MREILRSGLRSVRQLAPAVLIGGLTGFALIGPVTHLFPGWAATPPEPAVASTPPTPAPTSSASCYRQGSPPAPGPTPTPAATTTTAIWVNTPLGVNLRAGPSATSAKLGALAQGMQAAVIGQQTGGDGALWYHVTPAGQPTGWVHSAYVVTSAIHVVATGEGWSLMVPDGYVLTRTGAGTVEMRSDRSASLPFLEIAVVAAGTPSVAAPVPAELRTGVPWVIDHAATVEVWDSQPTMTVSRAAIDTCLVPGATERPDGGWAWVSAVSASTSNRQYSFLFISGQADDPLITQVLASVRLS